MDAPGGSAGTPGAARAVLRARRSAHRGGRRRCPPGERAEADPRRRSGAGARRGARPRSSRARPRLPGDGPHRVSGIPGASRTTATRSSSRPRPGRGARSRCSTTTSASTSGSSKDRRHPWRSSARGSPTRRPEGLPRCTTLLIQSTVDGLVGYGRARRGAQPRRRDGPAPGSERRCVRPRGDAGSHRRGSSSCGVESAQVSSWLEWLESAARETEDPQFFVFGLGAVAQVRAALGQDEAAAALLAEIETYPGARGAPNYPVMLPAMVRTALGIGEPSLAERLVAGFEPRTPYAEHALVTANAALAEARGDLSTAADAYADAADRWERFGVVPEQAFALLGHGRCLIGLSRGPRPHPSCNTPARSSNGSRPPPRSPRPTRSCSRRPRSVPRPILVNTWSRSRPDPTVLDRYSCDDPASPPQLRRCSSERLPPPFPDTEEVRGSNPLAPTTEGRSVTAALGANQPRSAHRPDSSGSGIRSWSRSP